MLTIKWFMSNEHISQMYYSGLQYAFVSEDDQQCHPLVYCKDFLQDCVHAQLIGRNSEIHGFKFLPNENPPICLKITKILLAHKHDFSFAQKILNCQDFLTQICTKLRLKNTKFTEVENVPKKEANFAYVSEGSAKWMLSPIMLSLYSLLLRIGMVHVVGNGCEDTIKQVSEGKIYYNPADSKQLKSSLPGIKKIFSGFRKLFGKSIESNYPAKLTISQMHNYCGIVGFSNNLTKSIMPNWHEV